MAVNQRVLMYFLGTKLLKKTFIWTNLLNKTVLLLKKSTEPIRAHFCLMIQIVPKSVIGTNNRGFH